MASLKHLLKQAQRLSRYFNIHEHEGDALAQGAVGYVEHTIHELCHAKTMRLNLDQAFGDIHITYTVGIRLTKTHNAVIQMANERRTLTVEWLVLRDPALATIGKLIGWDGIAKVAVQQGIKGDQLTRLYAEALSPWARKYSQEIVHMLTSNEWIARCR